MRPIRVLAAVLLFAVAGFAQTNRGGISGTVLDQNGAAIHSLTVTVSNVVNNTKHVTAETPERVERAVAETGYVMNQTARALAQQKQGRGRARMRRTPALDARNRAA